MSTRTEGTGWLRRLFAALARLWASLRGPRTPIPPLPALPPAHTTNATTPIRVLALGEAFDFVVHAELNWSGENMHPHTLAHLSRHYHEHAHHRLHHRLYQVSRNYPPHGARQLAADLNAALAREAWDYTYGTTVIQCRPRIIANVDERVRDCVRPYWQQRIELECQHELALRRAQVTRELTEAWTSVLDALRHRPLTPYAAELTDAAFATVVQRLDSDARAASKDLVEVMREAARGHEAVGLYEFAETWEQAIRAFQAQHGVRADAMSNP